MSTCQHVKQIPTRLQIPLGICQNYEGWEDDTFPSCINYLFGLVWRLMTLQPFSLQQSLSLSFVLSRYQQSFLSLKLTPARDNIPQLIVMDQHLKEDDFSEHVVNVDIPLRNTNNEGEKSNKCNQCEYASSEKSRLRSHLKIHSGEKSN